MEERELIIKANELSAKIFEFKELYEAYEYEAREKLRKFGQKKSYEYDRSIIKLSESVKAFAPLPSGQPCPTCGGSGRIR